MPALNHSGLVLRLRPLGESDLLVDLYTQHMGRATAIAKGARRSKKRFFGVLLAGHYLQLGLAPTKSGDLWLLESTQVIDAHPGLRSDYKRLLAASVVLELLLRATAVHDCNPDALELALSCLKRIELSKEPAAMLNAVAVFLSRLLKVLGYGLNLDDCLLCGRPANEMHEHRLSLSGGLVCPSCPPEANCRQVPAGVVNFLKAAGSLELASLQRLRLAADLLPGTLDFLAAFWRQITGHDLPGLNLACVELARRSG